MSQELEIHAFQASLEDMTYQALVVLAKEDLPQYIRFGLVAQFIKERKLYREGGYRTWRDFCEQELKLTQQRVGQILRASQKALEMPADERPRHERQLRPTPKVKPENRRNASPIAELTEDGFTSEPVEVEAVEVFDKRPETQLRRAVAACLEAGVAKAGVRLIVESCLTPRDEPRRREYKGPLSREATGGRSVAARKDMEKHRQ